MSTSTWDLAIQNEREGSKTEVAYVKFNDGNNQMRILDKEPVAMWVHWLAEANNGKGLSVNCLGQNCPACEQLKYQKANKMQTRNRVSRQFAINVYNRTTKQVELLQKGKTIFETLATYHKQMGDITGYDINIVKSGRGLDTKYTVVPVMQSEAIPSDLELYDLTKISETFSREMVELLMTGQSIEEAKKTLGEDINKNNMEEIETEGSIAPFK